MSEPDRSRPIAMPAASRKPIFAAVTVCLSTMLAALILNALLSLVDDENAPPIAVSTRPSTRTAGQSFADQHFEAVPVYESTAGGMRLKRSIHVEIPNARTGEPSVFKTNRLGHRGPEVSKKRPGERRILVLGDSITCAVFMNEADTYPGILAELSGATVYNAAVTGLGLREELLVLTETGLQTEPDVVVVGLYLNDAHASQFRSLPEGLLENTALGRRLRQLRESREATKAAELRYETLARRPPPRLDYAPEAWRTDREALEALIAGAMGDWGYAWFEPAWHDMRPDFEIMRALAEQHGFRLVVVLFPVRYQVEADYDDDRPQRHFVKLMRELDIDHVDLLPPLRESYLATRESLTRDHCHLTPGGHRLVSRIIAEHLQRSR